MINLFKLTRLLLLNCQQLLFLSYLPSLLLLSPLVAINNSAFSILYPQSSAITSSIGNWRKAVVQFNFVPHELIVGIVDFTRPLPHFSFSPLAFDLPSIFVFVSRAVSTEMLMPAGCDDLYEGGVLRSSLGK